MTHRNRRRLATVVLAPAAALVAWAIVRLLGIELDVSADTGAVGAGDVVAAALAGAPGTRTLILTTFGRPGYLRRAIQSGAGGFLLKDAPAGQLADTVREVYAGRRVIDPGLAAAALADGVSPLTDREHDVLVAATRHATAAEIAVQLHLSEGTVHNYLSAAMPKLGARNRVEAMRIAEVKGWL